MEHNRFKDALLERKEFIYTLELVPGRGSRGKTQDEVIGIAEKAAKAKLVSLSRVREGKAQLPTSPPSGGFHSRFGHFHRKAALIFQSGIPVPGFRRHKKGCIGTPKEKDMPP